MSFSKEILRWYHENKRDLPWRSTKNPYTIWLSEIILQQTRVAQGTPYYLRFVENFPTVHDLASASEEEVLKLWQGLGYYSRARNLHATAKKVVSEYMGVFPDTYKELLKLKGVGDYTASAIASICYDEPKAVVDGNVYRVLARYYGIATPINSAEGIAYFKALAEEVMDSTNIRDYNQGIMEFGAMQCAPKKPYCLHCPLSSSCVALQNNTINELPVKLKKTKLTKRFFNYIVPVDKNQNTCLRQREGKGIWQSLWEFPLIEAAMELPFQEVEKRLGEVLQVTKVANMSRFNEQVIVHKLSHQHLYTTFWIVETTHVLEEAVTFDQVEKYPVPVLIADFIKTFKNSYF